MARKKKNVDMGPVKIDLTPLIDCVFLLIIFFIVAGKFKKQESRLNAFLPKDIGIDSRSKPDPDRFFIAILCLLEGSNKFVWKVNNVEVNTRGDLVRKIKEIKDSTESLGKNIKVSIDGEPGVPFYWIIASLDACAEADLTEVLFAPPRLPLNMWPKPYPKNIPIGPGSGG
ncbi:MAG: hypothetical protein Kow00107_03090 [Planctomycetota bacterium]